MLDHSYAANPVNNVGNLTTALEDQENEVTDIDLIKDGEVMWNGFSTELSVGLAFHSRNDVRKFVSGYCERVGNKMFVTAGGASDGCTSNSVS